VFQHEMPGGQYTNLMFQAQQLGLGSQWTAVKQAYIWANELCGDIVKVTPSSKVVGDFAQWMVSNKFTKKDVLERAKELDFPNSVVEFFQGYLGQPVGGFPEPLRSQIIREKKRIDGRPGATMKPYDFDAARKTLQEKYGRSNISSTDVLSYCMYPKVFEEYREFVDKFGDLSIVPTRHFLGKPTIGDEMNIPIEAGKTLIIRLLAIGTVSAEGTRVVWFELNGETRAVTVEDNNAAVEVVSREKATSDPGSVGSPMSGVIVEVRVKQGQEVKAGDPIAIMAAMKMEQSVTAPVSGKIEKVCIQEGDSLAQGDLIALITHA